MATTVNQREVDLAASSTRTILDSTTIDIVVSNPIVIVNATSLGVPTSYSNTGTNISVSKNGIPLVYGTTPGTYSVTAYTVLPVAGITLTTGTGSGNIYTVPSVSNMSSTVDSAVITYTISVKDINSAGTVTTFQAYQTINKVKAGATGTDGQKSIVLNAFAWTNKSNINSVTYNTSMLCAVGANSSVAISTDGITWNNIPSLSTTTWGTTNVNAITWSGTQFCVVGDSGKVATSIIGTASRSVGLTISTPTFTYSDLGTTPSPTTSTITATAQNTTGTVYYEFLVGTTSVQNTTSSTYTYTPTAAFSSMPQQVTVNIREVNNTGTIVASDVLSITAIKPNTDLNTAVLGFLSNNSTTLPTNSLGAVTSFTGAGGTFYIYDSIVNKTTSTLVTYSVLSSSGVTISINSSGVYTVSAVSSDNGTATLRAVYNGFTVDKIYTISRYNVGATGNTWTYQAGLSNIALWGTTNINDIVYAISRFVVVGDLGNLATSPDGVTWTRQAAFTGTWGSTISAKAIASSGTIYCVVGDSGKVATSNNAATTWVSQASLAATLWGTTNITDIIWTGSVFCVVGEQGKVATSTTGAGTAWTNQTSLSSTAWGTTTVRAIALGTIFCVVGDSGKVATSTNGTAWTYQAGLSNTAWGTTNAESISWTGTQFCVVGAYGYTATSPDGVTWTYQAGLSKALINFYTPSNSGAFTYTWATGAVSAYPAEWTAFAGASTVSGQTLKQLNLTVTDVATATTTNSNWSSATSNAVYISPRGSLDLYITGAGPISSAKCNAAILAQTGFAVLIIGDQVTESNGTYVGVLRWDGTSWVSPGTVIDGSLIVSNSITAAKINTNGLSIKDLNGNTIFSSGVGLSATYISSLNADVITSGTLNASLITAGTLSADRVYGGTLSGASIAIGSAAGGDVLNVEAGGTIVGYRQLSGYNITAGALSSPGAAAIWGRGIGNAGVHGLTADGWVSSNAHGVRGTNGQNTTGGLIAAANGYNFYADGTGIGDYGTFTGAHDSIMPIGHTAVAGDILVDVEIIGKNGMSNVIAIVAISDISNDKRVVGVLSGSLGLLSDQMIPNGLRSHRTTVYQLDGSQEITDHPLDIYLNIKDTHEYVIMNALGEGQINVCGEQGNIEIGDLIVSSSIPGKGMRQSDDIIRNYTVAKSRESITFSSLTEVKMIACIYLCG